MRISSMVLAGALALMLSGLSPALAAGVIAVNDEEGVEAGSVGYGIGHGKTTESAGSNALSACTRNNPDGGCEIRVRYGDNQCGAYATGRFHHGAGTGPTRQAAAANALDRCGAGCKVVVQDCAPDAPQ